MSSAGRNCLDSPPADTSEGPPRSREQGPVSQGPLSPEALSSRPLRVGARICRPSPFPGRARPRRPLQRQVQAGGASREKQGAVPTAQRLRRRPPRPAASPVRSCTHTHGDPTQDPKQDLKGRLCVFHSSLSSYKGGLEAGEKNFPPSCAFLQPCSLAEVGSRPALSPPPPCQ